MIQTPWYAMLAAMSGPAKQGDRVGAGCGWLLATSLFACVLLVANAVLLSATVVAWAPVLPLVEKQPKLRQALIILGTLVLLVVEWRVLDWLASCLGRRRAGSARHRPDGRPTRPGRL